MTTKPDLETISLEQFLDTFVANEVNKWKCYGNQTAYILNSPDESYHSENPSHDKAASQIKTILRKLEMNGSCYAIFRIWPVGSISKEGHVYCVELHEHKERKTFVEEILEFVQTEALPMMGMVEELQGRMKADAKRTFLKFDTYRKQAIGGWEKSGHLFLKECQLSGFEHVKDDLYRITYRQTKDSLTTFVGTLNRTDRFNINDMFEFEAVATNPEAN